MMFRALGRYALFLLPAVLFWGTAVQSRAGERNQTDANIKFFQTKISQDPDDFSNFERLGSAFLQKGRETGNLSYYELSEKAMTKAVELAPAQLKASPNMQLAAVMFAEHRFQESLELARTSLKQAPEAIAGNATLGDDYLESGDYDRAAECYAKLQAPNGGKTPGLDFLRETRTGNLSFMRGDTAAAIEHMHAAIRAAAAAHLPKENQAWTYFTLGEFYLQSGRLEAAWEAGEKSASMFPGYHRALALEAQARAAQQRYPEASALYQKAMAAVPLPVYAAAMGDVDAKLGREGDARKEFDLVETIANLSALGKTLYNRELAMFFADHDRNLPKALELIEKEIQVRKDVYTWDALAWTLYKNGKSKDAAEAAEHALSIGTKDALLYFHAGMIYRANGNDQAAERLLRESLSINPNFHVLYADAARETLAQIDSHRNLAERVK
jgi:tetratricopeptide (TPR) repeat protein